MPRRQALHAASRTRERPRRVRRSGGGDARAFDARSGSRMSVSYFIRYDVHVRDVAEFVDFYRTKHVPVLARWPGLRRVVLHTPIEWSDTWPVNRGHAVLLAQLEFASAEALHAAFASPERAAAR